jgi:hypothetical protein
MSVGRAVAGALVVLAVVVLIAVAAVGSNGKKTPKATKPTVTSTPTVHSTASLQTTKPTPTATAITHRVSQVTVNVLNGTARAGLAKTVSTKLSQDGYSVKRVGNAPAQQKTTIYYRPGERADAEALLAAHPELGVIQAATSTTPTNAFLTVILGSDYPTA